jgi:hypothetical protein
VRIKFIGVLGALTVTTAIGLSLVMNRADAVGADPAPLHGGIAVERELDPGAYDRLARRSPAPVAEPVVQTLVVGRGDTLMGMLTGVGVDRREAYDAIEGLKEAWDPRKLKPGQEIRVVFLPESPLRAFRIGDKIP